MPDSMALSLPIRLALRAARRSRKKKFHIGTPLKGSYLISTDRGIVQITGRTGRFLTCWTGYGIAVSGDQTFIVDESVPGVSRVISVPLDALLDGKLFSPLKARHFPTIYRQIFRSTSERIHQITTAESGELLVAATGENAIAMCDPATGETTHLYPFLDRFAEPIKGFDHNHINSVVRTDEGILFVAYKAGEQSLIGLIRDGEFCGWRIGPQGFHDIFPTETGFVTCDTFGDESAGRIITEDGLFMGDFLSANGCAPRGINRTADEWIVGHSHKGPRFKRFKGKGALIVKHGRGEPVYCEMPAAQIYQIERTDGRPITTKTDHVSTALENALGAPDQYGPVVQMPSEPSADAVKT